MHLSTVNLSKWRITRKFITSFLVLCNNNAVSNELAASRWPVDQVLNASRETGHPQGCITLLEDRSHVSAVVRHMQQEVR